MATSHLDRVFEVAVKTPDGGQSGTYATATCGCGYSEDILVQRSAGGRVPSAEPYERRFRNRGWQVGKAPGKHTCPGCQKKAEKPKAEQPRRPTPEQSRALLEALEIVFSPEAGFDEGYDDARVATEQNMPRRWVEDIREQFLGPVPAPKVDHIAEARKALSDLALAAAAMADAVDAANKARLRVAELQAVVSKHLEEVGQ
ncbi:hypothetical protein [Roseibium aggregatum]|uniref:hypothetical protein n=1 Tax=Roseibium aggregatum TaxID=187304 RepID=UPI001E5780BC|nr:hypothetical protein [Roseibium aggregatum]UES40957.1 hypothetical protein GFC08_25750 [Roseibium aggregatum]